MFTFPLITRASLGFGFAFVLICPVAAQITSNGAGTLVSPQGNQINISGGTQTGANLFHSFQDFNLNSAQVANFLSNPQTQNILGRINGGNPSFINGLLQVTGGNSNLFLMNPAGIVFGANASLNVPASFTATTANGIGFGNQVFNAFGNNNFSALTGNPDSFLFTINQAGSIVNAGNLSVGTDQNLSLIAGNSVNTGNLTASGGEIQLLAVPGTNRVRLSQPGQVLSLEFVPPVSNEFRAIDLPTLLTGSDLPGIAVNLSGQVEIAGTSLPNQQGMAVASGRIDVSSATGNGGVVQVMGDRVAALNSRINANGAMGGGVVRLGGEYLGGINTGIAPALRFNSQRTVVDRNSLIRANATTTGEGGRVIVWADQGTGFWGRITGRGVTGRGGFVEVSGKESLTFDGLVELPGFMDLYGTLLLDPTNITFVAGANGTGNGDATLVPGGIIALGDLPANMTISAGAINALGTAAADIRASGDIIFDSTVSFFVGGGGPVSITAGGTITSTGFYSLMARGRNVTISADRIDAPLLGISTFSGTLPTGNITVTAPNGISLSLISSNNTTNSGGIINLNSSQGNIATGSIDSASTNINGGAVIINAPNGSIRADSIRTHGNGGGNTSGTINLNARDFVQITGGIVCGFVESICSNGLTGAGNGSVSINHGGSLANPFIVGDSSINGSALAINAGVGSTITPPFPIPSFPLAFTQGIINFITVPPPPPPPPPTPVVTIDRELFPLLQNPPAPPTPAPIVVGTPPEPAPVLEIPIAVSSPQPTPVAVVLPIPEPSPEPTPSVIPIPSLPLLVPTPQPVLRLELPSPPIQFLNIPSSFVLDRESSRGNLALVMTPNISEIEARLGKLEGTFQSDFQQYLGIKIPETPNTLGDGQGSSNSSGQQANGNFANGSSEAFSGAGGGASGEFSLQQTQIKLERITTLTEVKPALVYVFFAPQSGTNNFNSAFLAEQTNRAAADSDFLEVIMITGQGEPIQVKFPDLTRRQVMQVADEFRSEATNFRSPRGFLRSAQQMYQWLLAPLEAELQKRKINDLVFLMDTGLRSIPLAAMHDGEGFIVERYSASLMPSLNLTEPTHNPLDGSNVLAMGATSFQGTELEPLPAVSLEVNTVSNLWQGSEFLNDSFTLNNLIQQRQNRPFRMIHLATHGAFNPGDRSNSFIQLWDGRLRMDQLDQLNWGNPPVDLLVLSACETALGDRDAELGFAGLAINAGVRSALASLWNVDDTATLGLMTNFYQQLQVTRTKSEALRQAQLSLLRGEVRLEGGNLVTVNGTIPLTDELRSLGDRSLRHPYFWSAFTMVGNPW